MSRYLGIDPGLTGAFALLEVQPDGHQLLQVTATPVDFVRVGRGRRRRYALDRLNEVLGNLPPVSLAYVEAQSARPGQSAAATFTTGFGDGMWRALLTAHLIPFAVVSPQRWRSRVGVSTATAIPKEARKAAVRIAASRRFPAFPIKLEHADAVMLAVAAALEHDADQRAETYA